MPYPNERQWVILWLGSFVIAFVCAPAVFLSLAYFEGFEQLFYWHLDHQAARLAIPVIIWALLLLWQFSRPVRWRSSILIPILFLMACGTTYVKGAVSFYVRSARERRATWKVTPEDFMKQNRARTDELTDEPRQAH